MLPMDGMPVDDVSRKRRLVYRPHVESAKQPLKGGGKTGKKMKETTEDGEKRNGLQPQSVVGLALYSGDLLSSAHVNALPWYKLASDQGNAHAQAMLGACYFSGTGVRRDAEEAVSYWKIAAAKGEPLAQTNLGFCYESGVGVKRRDPATMVKWWHQAAARGVMEAQYNLAVAYNMHAHICLGGMEAAAEYAFNNFKASAEQGFAAAQNNYAVCLTSGSGGKRNLNAAFMLFRKSAEQGLAAAQNNLAICYYNGDGCAEDFDEAVRYYHLAAEQGLTDAMSNLGNCCLQAEAQRIARAAHPPPHPQKAGALGKSATGVWSAKPSAKSRGKAGKAAAAAATAAAAEAEAIAAAAKEGEEEEEEEVLLDAGMAFKWFKIAADQGSAAAQFGLGNCYLEGRGVGKDTEVGIGLWKMSAEQNYAQAKAALKEMIKKPAKPSKGNKGKKGKGGRGGGKRDAGSAKKKGGTTSKVGFGKKT